MAKDDYHVIVYKILLYLYAVLKRKIVFDKKSFDAVLSKSTTSEEYLMDVIRMMQDEGLIKGACFTKVWGHEYVMASDISEITITPAGIAYLEENTMMKKVGSMLKEMPGMVSSLINIVNQ